MLSLNIFTEIVCPLHLIIVDSVATTVTLDFEWRQAVCRHLFANVGEGVPTAQAMSRIMPVLQALYPNETPVPWEGLMTALQDLVNVFRHLRVQKDIFAPFFPTKGAEKTSFEVFYGNQVGPVFLCIFPGLTRRYWDEQSQSFYEVLLMPAFVELESALMT